ncbi:MAG: hypothetical protein R3357_05220, partial [Burkholderiales bacterium]|nr:hypothetical protein [Burkholderiales bacterium]
MRWKIAMPFGESRKTARRRSAGSVVRRTRPMRTSRATLRLTFMTCIPVWSASAVAVAPGWSASAMTMRHSA